MTNYEEKMLAALADKYRKSKKDQGTNVIARRTKISPSLLYKQYSRNDGDPEEIQAVNQAAARCQEKGFLTFETAGFSNEIESIYLNDSKIDEIERCLEETGRYESKSSKRRYVEGLISTYSGRSPAAERECERLRQSLEKNRIPQKYLQTEDLLKALVFIENNEENFYLREASMLIYGDSKYLEENTLYPVCRALRDSLGRPCGEDELEDEILEEYHITREKQKLCIKGDVVLRTGGKELDLSAFKDGIEFFAGQLKDLEWIHVRVSAFLTVENYTSWLRLSAAKRAVFYLGGYATRDQRDFLKTIYACNPGLTFLHFGDIDAGGFYIHEHLCRVTGIPFQMYRMSRAELQDPRFKSCLHPLTKQDRLRLGALETHTAYGEMAGYMLEWDVKLEQEIVSYYEDENASKW